MHNIADKSIEQKDAEAEVKQFHDDLGPFVVAAETTRMAMVFTDAKEPGHPIIFANDSFLDLTGYTREEVLGQDFNFLLAHAGDGAARSRVETAMGGDADGVSEISYRRKDGSEFWAGICISPVRDESGAIVQHFVSIADLSIHKDAEVQSKMLIDELNHRVKNILSTVQSVVWQALRTESDPKVIREAIGHRLSALSRSHDLLARENWKSAGLNDIVADALEPFTAKQGRKERIFIVGDNLRFPPKAALALGIAFNELATNAVKYGALSNAGGSVHIEWKVDPQSLRLILCWRETGGPPVAPPLHKGFGSSVLERGLAHELDGRVELDYRSDGVACTIDIPAPQGGRVG